MTLIKVYVKIMADFCVIILNYSTNFMQKDRKRNGAVPFCVPLILEASVPTSFLDERTRSLMFWFLKNRQILEKVFVPSTKNL